MRAGGKSASDYSNWPGHEALANEAKASVEAALSYNSGPFNRVFFLGMPDLEGKVLAVI
jgi:hypothetical protein